MEYQIVSEQSTVLLGSFSTDAVLKRLENRVNELAAKGWKPQGGVDTTVVIYDPKNQILTYIMNQAMVKE